MKLSEVTTEYLLSCEANGLSLKTIKWYRSLLGSFAAWQPDIEAAAITTHQMRVYIIHLRQRLAINSVADHVTALHAFWAWYSREYQVTNPMHNIKRAKRAAPEPRSISAKDFMKLFQSTRDDDAGIRDRALLAFLADTGARLGGVVTLTKDRLYINEGYALLTEKGDKTRRVPFTSYTARLLHLWLGIRQSKSDYVFTSVKTGEPLTDSGVSQMIKRLKRRAGVAGRANPHSFRHNFAREYLKAGGDVVTLARLMGHSDVNTTAAYYAVFSDRELAELHKARSPLMAILRNESYR